MSDSQFCAWCLERKNKTSEGTYYCIDCTNFLCVECAEPHLLRKRHRIPPASNLKFCDLCSHTHACGFCWDCKWYLCDICEAKHRSTRSTNNHAIEHHQWDTVAESGAIGGAQTKVSGITGINTHTKEKGNRQKHNEHTKHGYISGSEPEITSLIYSDTSMPIVSSQVQQSDKTFVKPIRKTSEAPDRAPAKNFRSVLSAVKQLPQPPDLPPPRPPKPVTASTNKRQDVYAASEDCGTETKAVNDCHTYDYAVLGSYDNADDGHYYEDLDTTKGIGTDNALPLQQYRETTAATDQNLASTQETFDPDAGAATESNDDTTPLLQPRQQPDPAPRRKPKPVTTSTSKRQGMKATPESYNSDASTAFKNNTYDYTPYIQTDVPLANDNYKQRLAQMQVLSDGNIILYDEDNKQLILFDSKLTKCQSSHQMMLGLFDMCTVRFGTEDRIYVVLQGTCSKQSDIIHFVIDKTAKNFLTKGSMTVGYECSGLTGIYSGIAVIQNMKKGRILLHLYSKDYTKEKVLPFDLRLSRTNKSGGRLDHERRYSLSVMGCGKLVVIADCKYNLVTIVDVERGEWVLKFDNASITCPSQVATYKANIVFILCKESGIIHVMEITGTPDQRRELTSRDTIDLKEWSPGAMCCSSSEGKLYVSHSQIGTVRSYKLSDTILQ